jgi:hypothetical protein
MIGRVRLLSLTILLAAIAACGAQRLTVPGPSVSFTLNAPLCSSIVPIQLSIDSTLVATDTFVVHIAGREHTTSRAFPTTVGRHTLSARIVGGFVWPDTIVTLAPGGSFTDSLPMYCS